MRVPPFLAERRPLELREILEPADAHRAHGFVAGIDDDVRRLPVVPVENEGRRHAVFLKEADAADGLRVQELFIGRHQLAADTVVTLRFRFSHLVRPPDVRGQD